MHALGWQTHDLCRKHVLNKQQWKLCPRTQTIRLSINEVDLLLIYFYKTIISYSAMLVGPVQAPGFSETAKNFMRRRSNRWRVGVFGGEADDPGSFNGEELDLQKPNEWTAWIKSDKR